MPVRFSPTILVGQYQGHGCIVEEVQRPKIIYYYDIIFKLLRVSVPHSSQVPVWPVVSMPAKKRAAISGNISVSFSGRPAVPRLRHVPYEYRHPNHL